MGGCWIMCDANDEIEVKNNAHNERWKHNIPGAAKAIVLLELFEVLERR